MEHHNQAPADLDTSNVIQKAEPIRYIDGRRYRVIHTYKEGDGILVVKC